MMPEGVLGAVKGSARQDVAQVIEALVQAHGHEYVNVAVLLAAGQQDAANPFARGTIRASDLPQAEPPLRLWFGLYPRSVALLIGETGAGKSSLIYNLCIHAARNEALWGVDFGLSRPLRVLYVDPENSGNFSEGQGGQCSVKIERIGQGRPVELCFHDGQGVNLANALHLQALREYIEAEKFDIVVLDPIANLFSTKDENDNAEAARQMTALTSLSRQTGVCVIAVHHTGKSGGGDYGRGASARLGAADVAFMFRAKGETEEVDDTFNGKLKQRDDQCRLQIVKNRLEGRGSLYLQMGGEDRFILSNFDSWKLARAKADSEVSKAIQAEEEIKLFLSDGLYHSRAEIIFAMGKESIGQVSADAALKIMEANEQILSRRKGKGGSLQYILASMYQPQNSLETPAGSFVVSQSPIEDTKLQNFDEPRLGALNTFFNAPGETGNIAAEGAGEGDEEGWK